MNFLDIGPLELLLILFLLLLVFGPHKLPEIAAQLGKGYRKLKAATSEMTREMQRELDEVKKETGTASLASEVAQPFKEAASEINAVTKDVRAANPAPDLNKAMAQVAAEIKGSGSTPKTAPNRTTETSAGNPRTDD